VNPQVGAVILDENGSVVAEGWHLGAGTPHAEVMALANARAAVADRLDGDGRLPSGFTAVVTLEPCNHTGKTGPCSQALIEAGISNVVYASTDPGKVSANGAETLRNAGINVVGGLLADEANEQGRVWLTAAKQGRPFVTLKWATSLDGRAAANDGTSQWISGEESRHDAHLRRSEVDAILVGSGTAMSDDPSLTARKPDGTLYEHQPLRVIIGETPVPTSLRIFNRDAETVQLFTQSIHGALAELWERGVKHVMVEGGPKVASKFVKFGLVNEYITYLAPMLLGGERTALRSIGVESMAGAPELEFKEVRLLGNDIFIRSTDKPSATAGGE
jgi:diaminohydroxyphosphoribosylaminopyrimidine deaminase/5-amino-6-(5-phosphoribosylamino)uracil reductase